MLMVRVIAVVFVIVGVGLLVSVVNHFNATGLLLGVLALGVGLRNLTLR